MQNTVDRRSETALKPFVLGHLADAPRRENPFPQGACSDHQFITLLDAYRGSGGLAPAQEVLALFRRHRNDGPATLTHLIIDKSVICFGWQSTIWLPLFQFRPADMSTLPGLDPVLAELNSSFDAWQLANWFAQPNSWLDGDTPTRLLGIDPQAVLTAARALRRMA